MSSGLLGLFDDVAALAKLAAASVDDIGAAAGRASVKAAGVVVDDTAVTPAYVHGLAADRELPIIKRIAKGSLKNKLLYIIPVALVLSEFTGAADELTSAYRVNPHDIDGLKETIERAVVATPVENRRRMRAMRRRVRENDVQRWARAFLNAVGAPSYAGGSE